MKVLVIMAGFVRVRVIGLRRFSILRQIEQQRERRVETAAIKIVATNGRSSTRRRRGSGGHRRAGL